MNDENELVEVRKTEMAETYLVPMMKSELWAIVRAIPGPKDDRMPLSWIQKRLLQMQHATLTNTEGANDGVS